MTPVVLVAIGSALGAPARYLVDRWIQSQHELIMPLGTFLINVTGSFLLGLLVGLSDHGHASTNVVLFAGTGALGGYTTFSTYTWESVGLLEGREYAEGAINVLGTVAAGLAAAALSLFLASLT